MEPKSRFLIGVNLVRRYGGASVLGMGLFLAFWLLPKTVFASTNIGTSSADHWAWNDSIGWIDFNYLLNGNVVVGSSTVTGDATNSIMGPISLNCQGEVWGCPPSGPVQYGITNNTAGGLAGWAWNNKIGWISFYWGNGNASSTGGCLFPSWGQYCGVWISQGQFHGFAWSPVVGYISFNYQDLVGLGVSVPTADDYWVQTTWVPSFSTGAIQSAAFNIGTSTGAELNSFTWLGSLTAVGNVTQDIGFQFATSSSPNGPWHFIGPAGVGGTSDVYMGLPNVSIAIGNYAAYLGPWQYLEYQIIFYSDQTDFYSPKVTGILIDWSP